MKSPTRAHARTRTRDLDPAAAQAAVDYLRRDGVPFMDELLWGIALYAGTGRDFLAAGDMVGMRYSMRQIIARVRVLRETAFRLYEAERAQRASLQRAGEDDAGATAGPD
jgi:hypothetical protein